MHRIAPCLFVALLFTALAASAEVLNSSPHGFTSRNATTVGVAPETVYAKLVQDVAAWWSTDHTISGDAANLRIDARQGGCFCETLPSGGSVRHLTVVHASPGKLLRMSGGLGPLQAEAVVASLSWNFAPAGDGTEVTATYAVGGYVEGGLDSWAAAVDGVIGEQLERLARYVVTREPQAEAPVGDNEGGSR